MEDSEGEWHPGGGWEEGEWRGVASRGREWEDGKREEWRMVRGSGIQGEEVGPQW